MTTPGAENGHVTGKDTENTICPWKTGALHTISRYNGSNDTRDLVRGDVERNGSSFPGKEAACKTNEIGAPADTLYVVESIPHDVSEISIHLTTVLYLLVCVSRNYLCNSMDE